MNKVEEKRQHVQRWRESGSTQKVYCQQWGIKQTTFTNWVKRCKEKPAAAFIPITPPVNIQSEEIELIYPNGVRLKVAFRTKHILSELIHIWQCSA
jgi:transposase-like protein